jgi:protein-disulfide isomerase
MSSRAEAKAKAKAAREAAQKEAQAAAARKRRLTMLGGAVAVAVVVIVAAILISQSGTKDAPSQAEATSTANTLFAGIPQTGNVLGDPKAPVTIEEFVDLQCPFCKRFSQDGLPDLVNQYVKNGKAKIILRTLTFIGADSERGARVAWGAAAQNRMFQFVENFYANQKTENTGYATESFLKKVTGEVGGLDAAKALDARDSATVTSSISASQRAATTANVDSTPTFLVGPTGKTLSKIETQSLTVSDFKDPIAQALKEAGASQ